MIDMKKRKNIGIVELAARCGVSVTTVSQAFSGKRPVSDAVKEKIFRVAEELNYRPNEWARKLLKGKTEVIGVIVDSLANPFTSLWMEMLEQAAYERGYQTWLALARGDSGQSKKYLERFLNYKLDGLAVCTSSISDATIRKLYRNGIPIATPLRTVEGCNTNPVDVDLREGIKLVLGYLYSLGHRKVALLVGSKEDTSSYRRMQAFKDISLEMGLEFDENLIFCGGDTISRGIVETISLLNFSDRPTAIVCASDSMAFNVMGTLRNNGVRVPEDISVTGFDNVPWAEQWNPPLTSVNYDLSNVAKATIEQLLHRIEKNQPMQTEIIVPELILRESCREL